MISVFLAWGGHWLIFGFIIEKFLWQTRHHLVQWFNLYFFRCWLTCCHNLTRVSTLINTSIVTPSCLKLFCYSVLLCIHTTWTENFILIDSWGTWWGLWLIFIFYFDFRERCLIFWINIAHPIHSIRLCRCLLWCFVDDPRILFLLNRLTVFGLEVGVGVIGWIAWGSYELERWSRLMTIFLVRFQRHPRLSLLLC